MVLVLVLLDKMLTNYHNIDLLHLLIPKSLILHTLRDPLNTLLSCYANHFGDAAASYTLHRWLATHSTCAPCSTSAECCST